MRRRVCGWFCLLIFAVYAIQPVLGQVTSDEGLYGERIQIGSDSGEPIVPTAPAPKQEGQSVTPWIIAGVTALGAVALGAVLLVDKVGDDKDDSDDAAADAARSAELAAAAAAAAADTAAAAAAPPSGFKNTITVTGTFSSDAAIPDECAGFTPSITFLVPQASGLPGGISRLNSSSEDTCGANVPAAGTYEQVSDSSVFISVDDGFYLGKWTVESTDRLRKVSSPRAGLILTGEGGAKVEVFPNP